jgi:precorrin-3B synthase
VRTEIGQTEAGQTQPGQTQPGQTQPGQVEAGSTPRGACPSVHRPFAEVDGALVRVRVPGGVLSAYQLRQVAAAGRWGTALEVTSRANLQIRGVHDGDLDAVTSTLVAAAVTMADPDVDTRRNVLASPTAGLDRAELVDCRALVADVERLLIDTPHALSPKFGVVVDGGGAVHVRGRQHDICLGAVQDREGRIGMEVRLGSALTVGVSQSSAHVIDIDDAAPFVEAALVSIASHPAASGRAAGLVAALGEAQTIGAVAQRAGVVVRVVDGATLVGRSAPSVRPIGILPTSKAGRAMVGAMPVLGRVSAETLDAVAAVAEEGGGQVRLTPWRSLVLAGVAHSEAAAVRDALDRLGFVTDGADPAGFVVACAGSTGCPAGTVDTQRDGRRLIELLRATALPNPASVHLSGCEKRCAAAGGQQEFALTLQGEVGEGPARYSLFGDESRPAAAPFGAPPAAAPAPSLRGLVPADALAHAVSFLTRPGEDAV